MIATREFVSDKVRADFPLVETRLVHGKPLVYLDSAATAQKPTAVIDTVSNFYRNDYSNINRGVYELAEHTTLAYEQARRDVAEFIGAADAGQLVFTSGTTEAINLVANGLGQCHIGAGDEIILSQMEHHANIVPWQQVCERVGARLRVLSVTDSGELDLAELASFISSKTKLVAVIHVSNVLGTINPVADIVDLAHNNDIPVLIDGAQAVAHVPVDVSALGCDFYVFSAHKIYGPTGVGALYAKSEWLDKMPPYNTGGDMIRRVSFEKTTFNTVPHKFEAGTQNIAGVLGFAAAIKYFQSFSWSDKQAHESELLQLLQGGLANFPGVRILGPGVEKRAALVSFVMDGIHAHDLGSLLDHAGVAVRVGHHCAMPLMESLGLAAATRVSLGLYNTRSDIDAFFTALQRAVDFFQGAADE